jgi:hypothetical protein
MKLVLEALRPHPAFVISRTLDLARLQSRCARAVRRPGDWPLKQRNLAASCFYARPRAVSTPTGNSRSLGCVARLCALAGADPGVPDSAALVDELLLKSPESKL